MIKKIMMKVDNLIFTVRLIAAINTRPSRSGDREDKKICDAKPGECRYNDKYYSVSMHDDKSWSMPFADDECPLKCPFLIDV